MHLGVRAQESSLSDVFAPGEKLRMPPYQRSYSWGETEALDSYREALSIYPLMPQARFAADRLAKKAEGQEL